eukprot:CAMPEP_0167784290 /NCGR_PEP_ID=MMETSP0111_2-20121227/7553_1 /TAXON_ID=91324 /ORGANISM="Lotharella globosa, Strain CCCM811" /LENGTH=162 /DNA_ID=CAMNT_0007675341 /DNA_START=30 /DNA_END=515 /DNA_ORIENTATION=+
MDSGELEIKQKCHLSDSKSTSALRNMNQYRKGLGSQIFVTRSQSFGNLSVWGNNAVEESAVMYRTHVPVGSEMLLAFKAKIDAEISIPLTPDKEDVWKSWRDVASKSQSRKKKEQASFVQSILDRVPDGSDGSYGHVRVSNTSYSYNELEMGSFAAPHLGEV